MGKPDTQRAAVYMRVSSLDQNPDLQLRELRQYAGRRGWEATEFIDHGVSGAETRRPQLAALTERLKRHEFDTVLVWKFDRVFRSVQHMVEFFELARHLQVEFISLTEQIDTTTPSGKLVFHVLAAIAEFERELIRERVLAGLQAAKARGVKLGRPQKILDVKRIMEDRRAGRSLSQIARELNVSKTKIHSVCAAALLDRRRSDR
jgi:DNA invertase Pin-like site-specific DNA recombinase